MTAKDQEKSAAELASSVDFSELILGFSSAALYYLGHSSIEGEKLDHVNLPLAKQNIDIVAMLQEKAAGNLSEDEAALIRQVLGDLRKKYQAAVSSSTKP